MSETTGLNDFHAKLYKTAANFAERQRPYISHAFAATPTLKQAAQGGAKLAYMASLLAATTLIDEEAGGDPNNVLLRFLHALSANIDLSNDSVKEGGTN